MPGEDFKDFIAVQQQRANLEATMQAGLADPALKPLFERGFATLDEREGKLLGGRNFATFALLEGSLAVQAALQVDKLIGILPDDELDSQRETFLSQAGMVATELERRGLTENEEVQKFVAQLRGLGVLTVAEETEVPKAPDEITADEQLPSFGRGLSTQLSRLSLTFPDGAEFQVSELWQVMYPGEQLDRAAYQRLHRAADSLVGISRNHIRGPGSRYVLESRQAITDRLLSTTDAARLATFLSNTNKELQEVGLSPLDSLVLDTLLDTTPVQKAEQDSTSATTIRRRRAEAFNRVCTLLAMPARLEQLAIVLPEGDPRSALVDYFLQHRKKLAEIGDLMQTEREMFMTIQFSRKVGVNVALSGTRRVRNSE